MARSLAALLLILSLTNFFVGSVQPAPNPTRGRDDDALYVVFFKDGTTTKTRDEVIKKVQERFNTAKVFRKYEGLVDAVTLTVERNSINSLDFMLKQSAAADLKQFIESTYVESEEFDSDARNTEFQSRVKSTTFANNKGQSPLDDSATKYKGRQEINGWCPAGFSGGEDVTAIVVDSGIDTKHSSFGGRAKMIAACDPDEDAQDYIGHGTHVAATLGSDAFGVAETVKIRGIKVGNPAVSSMICALNAIDKEISTNRGRYVVNFSLTSPHHKVLETAFRTIAGKFSDRVFFTFAAGNNKGSACQYFPALLGNKLQNAITVGAEHYEDGEINPDSNGGTCVQIYTTGSHVTSAWPEGRQNKLYGTSMAAPIMAGKIALLMGERKVAPLQVKAEIFRLESAYNINLPKMNKYGMPLRFSNANKVDGYHK